MVPGVRDSVGAVLAGHIAVPKEIRSLRKGDKGTFDG